MRAEEHWDAVYRTRQSTALSWYQPSPEPSLRAIDRFATGDALSLVDVGGGASTFVDALLERGWSDVTVLDIAPSALGVARKRLRDSAQKVKWEVADITSWIPPQTYDVWHDRAVFHFLTDPDARAAYLTSLRTAVQPGGAFVVATFALSGPEQCSGLPVARYSAEGLIDALGPGFEVTDQREIIHTTPWGSEQPFTWLGGRVVP